MKVHCTRPVVLRLFEMKDIGLGIKEARATGESLTLKAGDNEADDGFMKKWHEQNPQGHQAISFEKPKES